MARRIRTQWARSLLGDYRAALSTIDIDYHAVAVELGIQGNIPRLHWSALAKWAISQGLASGTPSAVKFRLRYRCDPAFRGEQIERAHKKKAKRGELLAAEDFTPEAHSRLFAVRVCLYCGRRMDSKDKTLDHIWPVKMDGLHSPSNAVVVCRSCNTAKAGMSPDAWLLRLPPDRRAVVRGHYRRLGIWGRGVRRAA